MHQESIEILDFSETDQEICSLLGSQKELVNRASTKLIAEPLVRSAVQRKADSSRLSASGSGTSSGDSSSFYSSDYQYLFPKTGSYEQTITEFGVLASFAEEEANTSETIVFPYDSSLESDPIYKGEAEVDQEEFKTSALISEVINKIISPIHESYRREMHRLEMKEKQLEDEHDSPLTVPTPESKAIPFNPYWETPYKISALPPHQILAESSIDLKGSRGDKHGDIVAISETPFSRASALSNSSGSTERPNSRSIHSLPPDPRPPPSFFQNNKPPMPHSSGIPPSFYDGSEENDNENYPPPGLEAEGVPYPAFCQLRSSLNGLDESASFCGLLNQGQTHLSDPLLSQQLILSHLQPLLTQQPIHQLVLPTMQQSGQQSGQPTQQTTTSQKQVGTQQGGSHQTTKQGLNTQKPPTASQTPSATTTQAPSQQLKASQQPKNQPTKVVPKQQASKQGGGVNPPTAATAAATVTAAAAATQPVQPNGGSSAQQSNQASKSVSQQFPKLPGQQPKQNASQPVSKQTAKFPPLQPTQPPLQASKQTNTQKPSKTQQPPTDPVKPTSAAPTASKSQQYPVLKPLPQQSQLPSQTGQGQQVQGQGQQGQQKNTLSKAQPTTQQLSTQAAPVLAQPTNPPPQLKLPPPQPNDSSNALNPSESLSHHKTESAQGGGGGGGEPLVTGPLMPNLSHHSQPFYPSSHSSIYHPAPYRTNHLHPIHSYAPTTDNTDDDSFPLIYNYPQQFPPFRPEQFSDPKLLSEYPGGAPGAAAGGGGGGGGARPPSPFLEKREFLKRQLQLSPTTKQQYSDFFKVFKAKEKEGFEAAKKYAADFFQRLPPKVHWKVYLEMADLAKRENRFKEARKYYEIVNRIQPYGCKGWVEYAKMEEECGRLHDCTRILADGLYFCPHSESLLVKGIKHSERMDNIDASRALLSRLKNVAIERSWRTMMEGGLLESRQGNLHVARQIFKYLMEKVPSYGPIYTEAVRLEMRIEEYGRALHLVEKGLQRIPSYGPLWFLAIKLEERLGRDYTKRVEEAVPNLSKELVWKIYFELAQIEERRGNSKNCYKAYVQSVLNCPSRNLVWKVWLGGARTELHRGNVDAARKLLLRALQNVPLKMKATALLECARFEEYLGDLEEARYILRKAKKETKHEWKVFLESVLLEMRANQLDKALVEVNDALDVHSTTGRLWAVLIQLTHLKNLSNESVTAQTKVFRDALTNVPKSGEVWCEGARIALHQGLLESARKYLDFAIQFTPQYGDSFIEQLRLELLCLKTEDFESAIEKPETKAALDKLELQCLNAEPTYGVCWTYCKEDPLDSARQILRNAKKLLIQMAKERANLRRIPQSKMSPHTLRKWKIHENLDIAASFFGEKEGQDKEFVFRTIFC